MNKDNLENVVPSSKSMDNTYKNKYKKYKKKNITTDWKIGQKLKYIKTGEIVELVSIHYDDITPYYTIKMPNNREKQTVKEKLDNINTK